MHAIETMAYVGAHPWHIGMTGDQSRQLLDAAAATTDVFIEAARMGWSVEKIDLEYRCPITGEYRKADPNDWGRTVQGMRQGRDAGLGKLRGAASAIVRTDTGAMLGAVGDQYTPFQNRQLFELGDSLCRTGAARWHTAGSLMGGRRVWALLKCEGQLEPRKLANGKPDAMHRYLLLYNSHDGSSRLRVRFTEVRVVCWNTCSFALRGDVANEFTATHRPKSIEEADVQAAEVLGLATKSWEVADAHARKLAELQFSAQDANYFFGELLLGGKDQDETRKLHVEKVNEEGRGGTAYRNKFAELQRLFEQGAGNRGESAFDAVNAVTEAVDWQRFRSSNHKRAVSTLTDAGLNSAQFGQGAQLKERALTLALQRVAA